MSNTSLKITVAGIRGKFAESLLPSTVLDFAELFGTVLGGKKVVLGTETRLSTPPIKHAVIAGLLSTGCEIIDIGIVATPTVQLMVGHLQADGGIMITASHNPLVWNGLKFISSQGIFLDETEMLGMFQRYDALQNAKHQSVTPEELISKSGIVYADIHNVGMLSRFEGAQQLHMDRILRQIDVELVKKAKLKVVVDCCNGAGAAMNPLLFDRLGIKAVLINENPDGKFTREPEPLPQNLGALIAAVHEHRADIGFAQDADADRLAIVNEMGQPIGEDYTLVLTLKYLLENHPNPKGKIVATNLSTTRAFDDIANQYGAKIIHTKIGEVNVSKALMENDSIVGGEGNGGVIIPSIGYGRDSFAGMAFMLEYMAKSKLSVSRLVAQIPAYHVVKMKRDLNSNAEIQSILERTKATYPGEQIDETDGIKIILKEGWLHVRPSNTEPIVRYFAEAKTLAEAQRLVESVY